MCAFHVKSPEIVTPKSLASLTNLMHSSPMTTGGKSQSDVKLMRSSLHLSVFNLTLFLIDQFTTSFTLNLAMLSFLYYLWCCGIVNSSILQAEYCICWSYYVKLTLQDITRHRKNSKQSGIVAIDSCFALLGARQYGAVFFWSYPLTNYQFQMIAGSSIFFPMIHNI